VSRLVEIVTGFGFVTVKYFENHHKSRHDLANVTRFAIVESCLKILRKIYETTFECWKSCHDFANVTRFGNVESCTILT